MRTIAIVLAAAIAMTGATWLALRPDHRIVLAAHENVPARLNTPAARPVTPKAAEAKAGPAPPAGTAGVGQIPPDLLARRLTIPVPGVGGAELRPSFFEVRGLHVHEAIDIMAPRGQPVVAVEDGAIAKLFTSVPGGLTIYQFDPTGTYAYYYAHLDHYADGLVEGSTIRRGQIIGYVGSTGDADAAHPHLHFAIFRLGPEKQWWKGEPLDPYPALTRR